MEQLELQVKYTRMFSNWPCRIVKNTNNNAITDYTLNSHFKITVLENLSFLKCFTR